MSKDVSSYPYPFDYDFKYDNKKSTYSRNNHDIP